MTMRKLPQPLLGDVSLAILEFLDHGAETGGALVRHGIVKRGSVYNLLGDLQMRGFVRAVTFEREVDQSGPDRVFYSITGDGRKVLIRERRLHAKVGVR